MLEQIKIKNAVAKNQMIFLQRCVYHNIISKPFRLKTPIKSKKAFNIMSVYKKKLIVIVKNNAKERLHNAALKINELCQTLNATVSEKHYLLIQYVTEKSRENEFIKMTEHLNVHSMNLRQHQVKESTNKLQPLMLNQASLTLRTLY